MARTRLSYPEQLMLANRLTEPAIRSAIAAAFSPAPGPRGLDAGCGIGLHTRWLAEAAGAGARVTGIDISEENLARARSLAEQSPGPGSVAFLRSNLRALGFRAGVFDWAYCADVLWPVPERDPLQALAELARVVRPGGTIAILFWTSQQLLTGYPELEARLAPAHAAWNPYLRDVPPEKHHLCAREWMHSVGLCEVTARTFAADVPSPLGATDREALAYCLQMLWGQAAESLPETDRGAFQALANPDSCRFIGDAPGYYGFITYTLFLGRRPPSPHRP